MGQPTRHLPDSQQGDSQQVSLPQETKGSVAVRVALGETQLVQEVRRFLLDNGVSLDSFSQVSACCPAQRAAQGSPPHPWRAGGGVSHQQTCGWVGGSGFSKMISINFAAALKKERKKDHQLRLVAQWPIGPGWGAVSKSFSTQVGGAPKHPVPRPSTLLRAPVTCFRIETFLESHRGSFLHVLIP